MTHRENPLPRPTLCPHCGAQLDASTNLDDHGAEVKPEPHDFSMCLHCGVILCYREDMTLKRAELEDLAKLPSDILRLLMRAQAAQHYAEQHMKKDKPELKH